MFLFVRASAFKVPNVDKCCACLICEEYSASLGDRNFPHAAVPVKYTSEFQQLFKATTYIKNMVPTSQRTVFHVYYEDQCCLGK